MIQMKKYSYEFGLKNISIEEYEKGSVKRLMNRVGKIGLKEILYTNKDKYYQYIWLVDYGKEEMAKDILEVLIKFDII